MSSADLIVRILADTTSANANINSLIGTLGKAAGVGAAGLAIGGVVKTADDYQSAMAKIQQADQSFLPGTQKYTDAYTAIERYSTTMATSFEDVAAVFAQAAKVTDAAGDKLPVAKVNELTDASLRLKAASHGSIDAVTALQDQAILSKLYSNQDFTKTGSAVAALTQQHPQNEQTLLDAAIAIAQYGAPIGVTEAQALGIGNFLSDIGLGGATGGASAGRTFQRMNTAADQVLDPEVQYSSLKQHRDASERLDDLQDQLALASERRSEMFGQHGLKTAYARNPAALMEADQHIAKLQREIGDQQQDIAHLDDGKNKASRGAVNILSMAQTAGEDAAQFAQEFKTDPAGTLLKFTRGVHNLPPEQREAALTSAGIVNSKDLKTLSGLTDQPDSVARMIAMANGEYDDPKAIKTISDIGLNTTSAKLEDLHNKLRNSAARIGEPGRKLEDAAVQAILDSGKLPADGSQGNSPVDQVMHMLGDAAPVLGPALGVALPGLLVKALPGAIGAALSLPGAAIGAAAMPIGAVLLDRANPGLTDAVARGEAWTPGAPPVQVTVGDVHAAGPSLQDVLDAVNAKLTAAWNVAQSHQPVSGQLGGNFTTGQGPH